MRVKLSELAVALICRFLVSSEQKLHVFNVTEIISALPTEESFITGCRRVT